MYLFHTIDHTVSSTTNHDNFKTHHAEVTKWEHFPRNWLFVRWIQRPAVDSHRKCQWHGALMFSLICTWVNNRDAGDLRCRRAHYDVTVTVQAHETQFITIYNNTGERNHMRMGYSRWIPSMRTVRILSLLKWNYEHNFIYKLNRAYVCLRHVDNATSPTKAQTGMLSRQ